MGHKHGFIYLDDELGSQSGKCSAAAAAIIQKKEVDSWVLLVNEEKSHCHPMQVGEWLMSYVIKGLCFFSRRALGIARPKCVLLSTQMYFKPYQVCCSIGVYFFVKGTFSLIVQCNLIS